MRRNSQSAASRAPAGQVLLLAIVLLAAVLGLVGAFVSYLTGVQRATKIFSARGAARAAAQSGIDKAIWCLNQSSGTNCGGTYGFNFTGENNMQVATSTWYASTVVSTGGESRSITAVGYYPSITSPISSVTLKADAITSATGSSFHYGVQSGQGGFTMGGNAFVQGNIYANGSVLGSNGAYVTGTAYVAGGTALTPDQQETTNSLDYTFGQASPKTDIAQSFQLSADNVLNKVSFYIKKVGSPSDATVDIVQDSSGVPSKIVIGSTTLSAANVTASYGWVEATFTTPPALVGGHTYWIVIDSGQNSSKYWIIGSHQNSGYGNGQGFYSFDWNNNSPAWTDAGTDFDFQAWTGGITTKIDNTEIDLDAHANTISNSHVKGDAYYQTLIASTVDGATHPGTADPGPQPMPVSESQIAQWKSDASAGGTVNGNVTYDGTSNVLGPKKITGNLTVTNGAHLSITGTIYVQGGINLSNNAVVSLDSGYGPDSGVIMADGKVTVSNNVAFQGSGTAGSYVLVLTDSTSLDTLNPAMDLNNNSANSIFYAGQGVINVANNATLKEVTAFQLNLNNGASVQYESGLANVNFSSGPSGSWTLKASSIREVR